MFESIKTCVLVFVVTGYAAGIVAAEVRVGGAAPDIALEEIIRGPDNAELTWPGLEGKAVVLEFWATWCGPCIQAIPHMNELVSALADEDIVFISISDEDEETVRGFLKERPIDSWIALDTDKSAFTDYEVHSIPKTILITKDRRIAAITHPTHVIEDHLRDLVAGRPVPELNQVVSTLDEVGGIRREHPGRIIAGRELPSDNEPLYAILLRETQYAKSVGTARAGDSKLTFIGQPFTTLVQNIYGTLGTRTVYEVDVDDEVLYDFIINLPESAADENLVLAQSVLEQAFGFTSRREMREVDVYLVRQEGVLGDGLKRGDSTGGTSGRGSHTMLEQVNSPFDSVVRSIERLVGEPLIDETALEGRWDLTLNFPSRQQAAVMKAVEEQLDLQFVPARREVEMLIVVPDG